MSDEGIRVRCIVRAYDDDDTVSVISDEAAMILGEVGQPPEWSEIPHDTIFSSEADTYERDMNEFVVSETELEGWVNIGDGSIDNNTGIWIPETSTPGTLTSYQLVSNEHSTTQGDEWDLIILINEVWVDNVNGDDNNNPGTEALPYASLVHTANQVTGINLMLVNVVNSGLPYIDDPGEWREMSNFELRGIGYPQLQTTTGTRSPIEGWNLTTAHINGFIIDQADSEGVSIYDSTDITYSDLTVSNTANNGILAIRIVGLHIYDVEIFNTPNAGLALIGTDTLFDFNLSDTLIEDCQIHNTGTDGLSLHTNYSEDHEVAGSNHIIRRVHSWDTNEDGIDINTGDTVLVEDCEMWGNTSSGMHVGSTSTNVIVRNCYTHTNPGSGILVGALYDQVVGNQNIIFEDCISENNTFADLKVEGFSDIGTLPPFRNVEVVFDKCTFKDDESYQIDLSRSPSGFIQFNECIFESRRLSGTTSSGNNTRLLDNPALAGDWTAGSDMPEFTACQWRNREVDHPVIEESYWSDQTTRYTWAQWITYITNPGWPGTHRITIGFNSDLGFYGFEGAVGEIESSYFDRGTGTLGAVWRVYAAVNGGIQLYVIFDSHPDGRPWELGDTIEITWRDGIVSVPWVINQDDINEFHGNNTDFGAWFAENLDNDLIIGLDAGVV